jgi:hypothetical protein
MKQLTAERIIKNHTSLRSISSIIHHLLFKLPRVVLTEYQTQSMRLRTYKNEVTALNR